MQEPLRSETATIDIFIKLAQFPILAGRIRERMREELFRRGVVSQESFEEEIKQKAIESQRREGTYDPFSPEPPAIWLERKARIRDFQTDFYFGHNLPTALLEDIIREVLKDQPAAPTPTELSFNPEVAPWEMLFRQGTEYESLPPPEREKISHHLDEIKAVLIKGMISDQLPYIGVARRVFDTADLRKIHRRRIGRGKIGGKAAGMLLAWKILQQKDPEIGPDISQQVSIPESHFLATDVIYEFRRINNLEYLMNQKYRSLDEIRDDYPKIVEEHLKGRFSERITEQLKDFLERIGKAPLIVRSSSLLEDNFGYSFAGKYQSYFCPNQGTPEQNFSALLNAIRLTYASTLNPDAILYRKQNQLIDYDERMAILLQKLQGQSFGRYFLPSVAGVGLSRNNFRWNPDIRREDGFLRMVWGIGTRAVDQMSNDYTRLVALSHPTLRPETTAKAIRRYAQRFVDVIDLKDNQFKTLPVHDVMGTLVDEGYPDLRYIASIDMGDYLEDMISNVGARDPRQLALTFDYLTRDRNFVRLMRTALMRLERYYERPVDVEFTVQIIPTYPQPEYRLYLLQCRPLSQREIEEAVSIPTDLPDADIVFNSFQLIPDGKAEGIRYVIFVDPTTYRAIPDATTKLQIGRAIGRLNQYLKGKRFVMLGPGRWGSANLDLGVRVTYADIFNTKALIEIAVGSAEGTPALSYGTHFYQDLVEAGIYALPIHLNDSKARFKWSFFRETPNVLANISPEDSELAPYLRVIDVPASAGGRRLTILMDGSKDEAIGFLEHGEWEDRETPMGSVSTF